MTIRLEDLSADPDAQLARVREFVGPGFANPTDSPNPAKARSRTSSSPESPPTGNAPRRTTFIPVYCFGLCEAVTQIPPSSPSEPTAW